MREYTPEEAAKIAARARAKADRREEWAGSRKAKAAAEHAKSRGAVAGIPFGQPVLVGHHSERRHRNAIDRSWNALGRAVEHSDTADRHQDKADRARAWADEVERRASGPRYARADLRPGDRLQTSGRDGGADAVVVRSNAKSVTAWAAHTAPYDTDRLAPIWAMCDDLNPGRVPWLKIRAAWRLDPDTGQWVEVQPGSSD